jgi:hypothetical protein
MQRNALLENDFIWTGRMKLDSPISDDALSLSTRLLNPFSTEPALQITLFFTCSNMGALIGNYFLDEASSEHEFSTMNRQDG